MREQVEKVREDSDQIIWAEDFNDTKKPIPHKNGFKRRVIVNFFGPNDAGKSVVVRAAQSITKNYRAGLINEITMDVLEEHMKDSFFGLPDPELALYFGKVCCTFGLSPWHIRLTEFHRLQTQATVTAEHFLYALYKYSK